MKFLASAMAFLGAFIAATSTSACWVAMWDEPEMPESLQD